MTIYHTFKIGDRAVLKQCDPCFNGKEVKVVEGLQVRSVLVEGKYENIELYRVRLGNDIFTVRPLQLERAPPLPCREAVGTWPCSGYEFVDRIVEPKVK